MPTASRKNISRSMTNSSATVDSSDDKASRNRVRNICIFLILAVLVVFGRSLLADFVDWDDNSLIYQNKNFNPPTWEGLAHHWNPDYPGNLKLYEPLVFTTWWGLAQIGQLDVADMLGAKLNPMVYHAANLIVQSLAAMIVLAILMEVGIRPWPAFAGALLFAIHPIQTEVVAWATGMKDLLSGTFALLAIWQYFLAAKSPSVRTQRWRYALASLAYLGALLSKAPMAVVPLIVAAFDLVLLKRPLRTIATWVTPWLILACLIFYIAGREQHDLVTVGPFWMRPFLAADALAFYEYKFFLPLQYCINYGRNFHAVMTNPDLHHPLYWTWIFPVATGLLIWKMRQATLTLAGAVFLLGVLPELGLRTFNFEAASIVADRYLYLSMLGAALALGWLLNAHPGNTTSRVVAVILVALGIRSYVQAGVWHDSGVLFHHTLWMNPDNAPANRGLAGFEDRLANFDIEHGQMAAAEGDSAAAAENLQLAAAAYRESVEHRRIYIQMKPEIGEAYLDLSSELQKLGAFDPAAFNESVAVLEEMRSRQAAGQIEGFADPALFDLALGNAYLKAGRYAEAVNTLQESVRLGERAEAPQKLKEAQQKLSASTRANKPQT
jgi:tetratricopeptide (TPR) repeat protein